MDTVHSGPAAAARRWCRALCVTLSLLIWPATPWAQVIYKSVDAAGHVTYSDRPYISNSPADAEPGDDGSGAADMSASTEPPLLPAADQPPCPEEGDLWIPGYWAWDGVNYYWVPGEWVFPPRLGVFWTPGYWAYAGNVFVFHRGYWGPQVGYYGGINYGFGYGGTGYVGGRWVGNAFAYNLAVNNLNASAFHHTYDEPVVNHGSVSRVSYNGGPGGTRSVPTAQERLAAQSRLPPLPQRIHLQLDPIPAARIASSTGQAAPAPKPLIPRSPMTSAPRPTASAVTHSGAPVNTAVRAAPTPPKNSRPRPTPAIKSIPIK
jgi:hypothetical protein